MNEIAAAPSVGSLMFGLLHAAQAVEGRMEEAFASVGLSTARFGVLGQLVQAGEPLPLSEIAARLSCVRSNMTQLVDRLEADGLVRRVNDPDDRRSIRAELTPAGRAQHLAGAAQLDAVQSWFESILNAAEQSALDRAVTKLGQ